MTKLLVCLQIPDGLEDLAADVAYRDESCVFQDDVLFENIAVGPFAGAAITRKVKQLSRVDFPKNTGIFR